MEIVVGLLPTFPLPTLGTREDMQRLRAVLPSDRHFQVRMNLAVFRRCVARPVLAARSMDAAVERLASEVCTLEATRLSLIAAIPQHDAETLAAPRARLRERTEALLGKSNAQCLAQVFTNMDAIAAQALRLFEGFERTLLPQSVATSADEIDGLLLCFAMGVAGDAPASKDLLAELVNETEGASALQIRAITTWANELLVTGPSGRPL